MGGPIPRLPHGFARGKRSGQECKGFGCDFGKFGRSYSGIFEGLQKSPPIVPLKYRGTERQGLQNRGDFAGVFAGGGDPTLNPSPHRGGNYVSLRRGRGGETPPPGLSFFVSFFRAMGFKTAVKVGEQPCEGLLRMACLFFCSALRAASPAKALLV